MYKLCQKVCNELGSFHLHSGAVNGVGQGAEDSMCDPKKRE